MSFYKVLNAIRSLGIQLFLKIIYLLITTILLQAYDANSKCSQNDLYIQREKSILRGHYKDVASQSNGAIISTARTNGLARSNMENSPLRNLSYFFDSVTQGHFFVELHKSLIVDFLQAYEINRIRFWMIDIDSRISYIQVYIIVNDRQIESLISDDGIKGGVITLKFPDQLVSKVKFYNKNGNSVNQYMSIIKIQAYYAFDNI